MFDSFMSFTTPLIPSVPSNNDIKLNSFSSIFKIFVIFGRYSFKKLFLDILSVKTLRFFSFPNSIWISIIFKLVNPYDNHCNNVFDNNVFKFCFSINTLIPEFCKILDKIAHEKIGEFFSFFIASSSNINCCVSSFFLYYII